MKIIEDSISLAELKQYAEASFGDFVKAVVDVEEEIMAIDAELHSDEESLLLQNGSKQVNLWGINIYPDKTGDERIEFDSMINISPSRGNRSRDVKSIETRKKIIQVVNNLIKK